MPAPIPDAKRSAILRDFGTDKPRNQIARERKVSVSTVTKLAKQVGHEFDRSRTKHATEAAMVDNKARRALLSRRFLAEAEQILDRMNSPYLVHAFGGKDNDFNSRKLDLPPAGEVRNFMTAAAVAFDKHIVAEKHDADTGAEGARSVLGMLAAGLQMAAEQIDGPSATDT